MRPKHMNGEYVRLREIGDMDGDSNNCSVISLAAGLDIPYIKAKELLEEAGRKKGEGAYEWVIRRALDNSGFDHFWTSGYRYVKNYKYSNTLTFNNAVKVLDKEKKYLLIGARHMAALKRGQVVDWGEGRKIRVEYVVEIKEE